MTTANKTKKLVLWALFAATAGTQANVYDDFESYTTNHADLALDTGNVWNNVGTVAANVRIDAEGTNQFLRASAKSSGGYRAVDTVTNGLATLEFDMWKQYNGYTDVSFGLSTDGGSLLSWNDFQAYVVMKNGELLARNAGANLFLMAIDLGTVYHIKIVADLDAQTYDVFVDDVQKATDFAFRNSVSKIDSLKLRDNDNNDVFVDNIAFYTAELPPTTLDPFSITSFMVAGTNATIVWNSQVGATYNILSASALSNPITWATNAAGIASAGDGSTTNTFATEASEMFFKVEGGF